MRGTVVPDNNYTTSIWDVNKHPDEQETVYHKDGTEYQVRDGKDVEIVDPQKSITIKGRDGEDKKAVPFQSVAQSPLWIPGRDENGDAVRVKYIFPVIFKL